MSKYVENDTKIVKYTNISGDTKQVVITPVGYFQAIKGVKFVKGKIPFKQLVNEFMKKEDNDQEKDVDIELIFDAIFDLSESLDEASKYFINDESFDITKVRDMEDVVDILKAVFEVNRIGDAIKNLMGSQAKNAKQ